MGLLKIVFIAIAAGGAVLALRKAHPAEAPEGAEGASAGGTAQDPVAALRQRTDEALAAAREAKAEKEAELQRQFEEAKRAAKS
jgi:hypothetical protein